MLHKNEMILTIDTHSNQCLVTLSQNGNLLAYYSTNIANKHDKLLAEFTRRILQDNNLAITNLEAISIVAGPGSFTGLRIGFAFVKGLTIESNIKLIKIPTTEIYAFQAKHFANQLKKERIASIIPGSSGKFFVQEFDLEINPISELTSINGDDILFNENVIYVGNYELQNYNLHKNLHLDFINPIDFAKISYYKFEEGKFSSEENFEPDYYFEFRPLTK